MSTATPLLPLPPPLTPHYRRQLSAEFGKRYFTGTTCFCLATSTSAITSNSSKTIYMVVLLSMTALLVADDVAVVPVRTREPEE